MNHYDIFTRNCHHTLDSLVMAVDSIVGQLEAAAATLTNTLLNDGKIISCGLNADSALAQLFSVNLLSQRERPALPAISLNADGGALASIACREGTHEIFSRPLAALGNAGDSLLIISSDEPADALLAALNTAHERNMNIVVLSKFSDQLLSAHLHETDIHLPIPGDLPARRVELTTVILQNLCEFIDFNLFGSIPE